MEGAVTRLFPLRSPLVLGSLLVLSTGCNDYEILKLEAEDIFYQLEASEVDVLLVVDNSCSMQPYQQKLSQNFNAFLTYFIEGNVDYQVGVVTTTSDRVEETCWQAVAEGLPEGLWIRRDPRPETCSSAPRVAGILAGSGLEVGCADPAAARSLIGDPAVAGVVVDGCNVSALFDLFCLTLFVTC